MNGKQFVLRYGGQRHGMKDLGVGTRKGKNAYWVTLSEGLDWQKRLLDILSVL